MRKGKRKSVQNAKPKRSAGVSGMEVENIAKEEVRRLERTPPFRLFNGYRLYIYIQWCHRTREGYLVQYVNDIELARAEMAIKAIKAQAIADEPNLGPADDEVWKKALQSLVGAPLFPETCQQSLGQLFDMSPAPVYSIDKP